MGDFAEDKVLENFTYLIGSTIKLDIEGVQKISYSPELPFSDTIHAQTVFGNFSIKVTKEEK